MSAVIPVRFQRYLSAASELRHFWIGGAYDTVPEVCILLALFENSNDYVPIIFDEAGESPCTQDLTLCDVHLRFIERVLFIFHFVQSANP